MLWLFWLVAGLVAVFVSRNVRYAFMQYWANQQRAVFTVYVLFLVLFIYIVMHFTFKVFDFTQRAKDLDIINVAN